MALEERTETILLYRIPDGLQVKAELRVKDFWTDGNTLDSAPPRLQYSTDKVWMDGVELDDLEDGAVEHPRTKVRYSLEPLAKASSST